VVSSSPGAVGAAPAGAILAGARPGAPATLGLATGMNGGPHASPMVLQNLVHRFDSGRRLHTIQAESCVATPSPSSRLALRGLRLEPLKAACEWRRLAR
jgi:hypothetical protein